MQKSRIINTPHVLLATKAAAIKEYLNDDRVRRAHSHMEKGELGQVFLELFNHSKVWNTYKLRVMSQFLLTVMDCLIVARAPGKAWFICQDQ